MIKAIFLRDVLFNWRDKTTLLIQLLFFSSFTLINIFTIGPRAEILKLVAPNILWMATFFTLLLHFDLLLKRDYEEGTLKQLFLGQPMLTYLQIIIGKMAAHWVNYIVPLLLIIPFMGLAFNLAFEENLWTIIFLAGGTIPLIALGIFAAALAVTLERSAIITALIVMPFSIPLLIFAVDTSYRLINGKDFSISLSFSLGLSGLYLILCPLGAAYTLRSL